MNISILNRPPRPSEGRPFDTLPPVAAGVAAGVAAQVKERLWQRMVRECEAMVRYALGTGLVVPADVMEHLDRAVSAPDGPITIAAPERPDAPPADGAAGASSTIETSRFAISRSL